MAVPPGNSSPVVAGERVFVTAVEAGRLLTLCFDRHTGNELWRRVAPGGVLKETRWADSPGPATPTPASDGTNVFVFFGAFGVLAYDLDGREQWRQAHESPDVEACSSPILVGDRLVVVSDREQREFVEARDKHTGRLLWRTDRPRVRRSGATPFHWVHGTTPEIVVSGSHWVVAYDPERGRELWRLGGRSPVAAASPTASPELLFTSSSKDGRDGNWRRRDLTEGVDGGSTSEAGRSDGRGVNEGGGGEGSSVLQPLGGLEPWIPEEPSDAGPGLLALRPGGSGLLSDRHVAWRSTRSVPYAASPLLYGGSLFTVKDGGFVSAYEAATGEPLYLAERLDAPGDYYASPVGAAGRVYFASADGTVTVIDARSENLRILSRNELGDRIFATPAIVDRVILFRTAARLCAFGTSS